MESIRRAIAGLAGISLLRVTDLAVSFQLCYDSIYYLTTDRQLFYKPLVKKLKLLTCGHKYMLKKISDSSNEYTAVSVSQSVSAFS